MKQQCVKQILAVTQGMMCDVFPVAGKSPILFIKISQIAREQEKMATMSAKNMFRTPTLALENNPSIKEVIYMMQVRTFLSYCVDFKTKANNDRLTRLA